MAQCAGISATWYTWLEQGRGGAPSSEVLERMVRALMLTEAEREHLFLLGLGRPPAPRHAPGGGVTPRLQRILDAIPHAPATVQTRSWDIVAWNRAAQVVLTDCAALPPARRNVLRRLFLDPEVRAAQSDFDGVARFVVAAFRADLARAADCPEAHALVEELRRGNPEFETLWSRGEVDDDGAGSKRLRLPPHGEIAFEISAFSVDGRPDLRLMVYIPATDADAARIAGIVADA